MDCRCSRAAEGSVRIDLNGLIGQKLRHMANHEGLMTVNRCYKNDHSHFSLEGAGEA